MSLTQFYCKSYGKWWWFGRHMQEDNQLSWIQYNYIEVSHWQSTCLRFSIVLTEDTDFPDIMLTYFNKIL